MSETIEQVASPPSPSSAGPRRYKPSRYNHFVQEEDGTRLAFNAVTNALGRMDAASWERYQALVGGAPLDTQSPVDQKLLQGRFLLPEDFDEQAWLRGRHLSARNDSTSWSLTICPTIACNFGCDYCYEVHKPGKMSAQVQEALVRMVEQRLPGLSHFGVTWYGGEPTMAWDVLQALSRRFLALCDAHGVSYDAGMVTNGYLLDEQRIAELPSLAISSVQVTLDGDAPQHDKRRVLLNGKGTFEKILKNLRGFIGKPSQVNIRVNVDGRNRDGVHALIDRLAAEGLAGQPNLSVYFAPVDTTTEPSHGVARFCMGRQDFARLEPDYYAHAARVGLSTIPYPQQGLGSCIAVRPGAYVVQSDGELHKCWDTVGQSQFAVGNLLDPARNPLESPEYKRWMEWDPFRQEVGCSSCSWLASCMGGCPLKVVHPELSPDKQVHLECTTFKFNAPKMLPMFARWLAQGNKLTTHKGCDD